MNKAFTAISIALVMLTACKKDEPEPEDNNGGSLPVINPSGCVVQSVLAWNANPYFTYEYVEDYPSVLNMYKEYDANSGNVTHTYVMHYEPYSGTFQLDSLFHYYGDIVGSSNYSDVTVFEYTFSDGWARMDSAQILVPDFNTGELILKGTEYYDYNENDQVATFWYYDNPQNSITSALDQYYTDYVYNAAGQMVELHTFDFNDEEVYSEVHQLSEYIQPNYRFIANRALAQANLFAPSQTVAWSTWTSTYTYNYVYQVNEEDYIIEQSRLEDDGDIVFQKLFTYECY